MSEKMEIDIIVNGKKAVSSIEQVDKATKKLADTTKATESRIKSATQSIASSWDKIKAPLAGVAGAIGAVSVAMSAPEQAIIKLGAEMARTKAYSDEAMKGFIDFASELQSFTGISATATLEAIAMAKSMGVQDDQLKRVIETSALFAKKYNEDLTETVKNFSKTLTGGEGLGALEDYDSRMLEASKTALEGGYALDIYEEKLRSYGLSLRTSAGSTRAWNETTAKANSALLQLANTYQNFAMVQDEMPLLIDIDGDGKAKGALDSLTEAWLNYSNTAKTVGDEVTTRQKAELEELRQTAESALGATEDYFVELAMTGKASFSELAQSVIADIMRIYVRSLLLKAVGGVFGGGLFHTGGEVKHTGGYIGSNLPTYHTGMRSDERIAKLQVGEAVINRAGARQNAQAIDAMNAGYKVGGGGDSITTAEINFNVQAIDASSFNSYLVNNKSTIEGIINNSLRTNGSVRKTIKQTV